MLPQCFQVAAHIDNTNTVHHPEVIDRVLTCNKSHKPRAYSELQALRGSIPWLTLW